MLPEQKLDALLARHQVVEAELATQVPTETFVKLSREHAELSPVVETVKAYRGVAAELAGLNALLDDPKTDAEMRAMANAENNLALDPDSLVVSRAFVDEGPTLKRFRPRAQGRAYRIRKRTSHITVEVESVPRLQTAQRRVGGRSRGGQAGTGKKATQTRSAR